MSEQVKRIDICIMYDGESRDIKAVQKQDGRFVLYTDYESLRLSHEETKAQLEALEDAIAMCFELIDSDPVTYRTKPHNYVIVNDTVDPLSNAIQNSRARNQNE